MQIEVLDSWAIIAWLNGEPAAGLVRQRLEAADNKAVTLLFSAINAGEIYYLLAKRSSLQVAETWLGRAASLPIRILVPRLDDVFGAAKLKAQFAISYADAFAASLAMKHAAPLVTGDKEFEKVQGLRLSWIA